jgi:hypothetical protein
MKVDCVARAVKRFSINFAPWIQIQPNPDQSHSKGYFAFV